MVTKTKSEARPRTVEVETLIHPGRVKSVDAVKYAAMKGAFLAVLPKKGPGLTLKEIHERLPAHLPKELFPEERKGGWWAKVVQLDLEAKGIAVRDGATPLRLRRTR